MFDPALHIPRTVKDFVTIVTDSDTLEEAKGTTDNESSFQMTINTTYPNLPSFLKHLKDSNKSEALAVSNLGPGRVIGVEIIPDEDDLAHREKPRSCRHLDDPYAFYPSNYEEKESTSTSASAAAMDGKDVPAPTNKPERLYIQLGNEGSGMNIPQLASCDSFVYINQYGKGMGSLNVSVAATTVLQRLEIWRRGL